MTNSSNRLAKSFSSLFGKASDEESSPAHKHIKSGIDGQGNPYIDLSDENTAKAFMKKTKAFEGIKTI